MSTRKQCGCIGDWSGDLGGECAGDRAGELSRRQVLRVGLAAAATVATGKPAELFAEDQTPTKSRTRQVLSTAGVRAIDIHAHYYPQVFLDLIAEEGKRFKADYRMTGEGFHLSAPAGHWSVAD